MRPLGALSRLGLIGSEVNALKASWLLLVIEHVKSNMITVVNKKGWIRAECNVLS